jgi:Leucyl-tRNA synthetase
VNPNNTLHNTLETTYVTENITIQSDTFDKLTTTTYKQTIIAELEKLERNKKRITYKLRD